MNTTETNVPGHTTAATESLPDFLNAVRNPHTLQVGVHNAADQPHYEKFCEGIIGCLNPESPLERQLAWSIASDYWRLNRIRNIEDGIFALAALPESQSPEMHTEGLREEGRCTAEAQTNAFLSKQSVFRFLSQYEMRVQRMINRNKAELKQLQTDRRRRENELPAPQPVQSAAGTQTMSTSGGFVFSEPAPSAEKAGIELPPPARIAAGCATVIPFNPASRTGTAPDGFVFSKATTVEINRSRRPSDFANA